MVGADLLLGELMAVSVLSAVERRLFGAALAPRQLDNHKPGASPLGGAALRSVRDAAGQTGAPSCPEQSGLSSLSISHGKQNHRTRPRGSSD